MPVHGADKGGRAAREVMTSHLHLALSDFDGRRLDHREKASSEHLPSSVTKKDIHAHCFLLIVKMRLQEKARSSACSKS
jgi:hypothetical protein